MMVVSLNRRKVESYISPGHTRDIRVMGVDGGTETGIALLHATKNAVQNTSTTTIKAPQFSGFSRLEAITAQFGALLDKHNPDFAVIEGYAYGNKFTIVGLVEIGTQLRLACLRRKIPLAVMSPTSLKKLVFGSGTAKKNQMIKAVYKRWGFDTESDDEADAYSLAMAGCMYSGAINCNAEEKITLGKLALIPCLSTATLQ